MRFLMASFAIVSIHTKKLATWFCFFLFGCIFFSISTVKATALFQEFKNDLDPLGHIKLVAIADPESVNPGGRFILHLKIEVLEGWHIYSLDAKGDEEESLATKIALNSGALIPQGLWEEPTPTIGWDGALERIVKTHEQVVEFRRSYHVFESLASGIHRIKGSIMFRACNNKICSLPREIPFGLKIRVMDKSS